MLHSNYQLTDPRPDLRPCSVFGTESGATVPAVGTYNNGLFTILDESASHRFLTNWSWLVGQKALALITTGFGDVFFWIPKDGVHFLGVQRAEVESVDSEIGWFLEEFMVNSQVVESVFRKHCLDELVHIRRPLRYGEAFILEPWLMLGGQDKIDNYGIGECSVYLELVCQTHLHSR